MSQNTEVPFTPLVRHDTSYGGPGARVAERAGDIHVVSERVDMDWEFSEYEILNTMPTVTPVLVRQNAEFPPPPNEPPRLVRHNATSYDLESVRVVLEF